MYYDICESTADPFQVLSMYDNTTGMLYYIK